MSIYANELWTRYQFVNLEVPAPSQVNTLFEDQLGQIWVGTDSGLYRILNNKLQKVSHAPKAAIEHLISAGTNDIWLATSDGVWNWQNKTNNFTKLTCTDEQSFGRLIVHPNLGLLALARSGVYQLSENHGCRKVNFDGLPEHALIERFTLFKQDFVIAVRGSGLFKCAAECEKVTPFAPELANTRVRELVVDKNTLYAGTHKHGFYSVNPLGEVIRHWHRNADTEPNDLSLPVNGVMTILPYEQSIWAGLWAGGLQQFDVESGKKISSSRFYGPDTTTLGGKHVRALLASNNGTLYVGQENGVSIILPAYNQQGWIGLANEFQSGFSHDNVLSIYHHNNTWLAGTSSGGFYRIGHADNKFQHMSSESPSPLTLPTKSVWEIIPSQRGDLLLGTSNGVIRLQPDTLDWQLFGDPSNLVSADVFSLAEAPDQTLWLSLWEGGITRLDKDGQLIGQWSQSDGLQQNTSIAIVSTSDNHIFVLNSAGLFRFASEQDKFVNAAPQNTCREIDHIITGLSGQLWALCNHSSLMRWQEGTWYNLELPTSAPILHIFSPHEGEQPDNEQLFLLSATHVFAVDANGQLIWQHPRLPIADTAMIHQASVIKNELVIATNHGLYRQTLDKPFNNTPQPAPMISGVRLFNKPWQLTKTESQPEKVNETTTLFQGQLQLDYDQDLITFEFAVPGYHHKAIQGFNYRLLPFDRRWLTTAEDEAKASYTRLPPGKYRFEAKVSDSNELPATTFQLEILPPWYLTWWAKTLALLTLILIVLALVLGRTRRLKQRNLWLQESVRARTAELEKANNKLQQAANLDALTGLLNRRGFRKLCDPIWEKGHNNVILMIADIDHFKQINDQYGHQLGDKVLVTCAQRLKSQAGEQDIIARWGGEEFLILLRDQPKSSLDNLKLRAQKLQQVIGETGMELNSENVTVTLTAGVCIHQGQNFEACLQEADQKLYDGKNAGRNRLIL